MPPKRDNQETINGDLSSQITAAVNAALEAHLAPMRQELLAVRDSNSNSTEHIGGRIDSLETLFAKFLHSQNNPQPPQGAVVSPSGADTGLSGSGMGGPTAKTPPRRNLEQPFQDFRSNMGTGRDDTSNTNYHCKLPKLTFSSFNGSDVLTSEEDYEFYFDVFQTPEMYKTRMATTHFGGDAREWYRGFKMDNPHPPWPILVDEVRSRFSENASDNPLEEFRKVIHLGKIDEYIRNFEKVKSRLMSSTKVKDSNFYLLAFLSGLRDEVRYSVEMCGPSCLTQAYKFARQAELSVEGQEKRNRTIARPILPIPTASKFLKGPENFDRKQTLCLPPPVKQATVPPDDTRMTFEHMRKLGLCYWCGEKYHQGHKCQKKKLHLLEAAEVEEGECSTDIENKVDFHIQEMAEEGYEQANISMCSSQGMEGTQTLKFKGVIKQLPILALIDSGSTHSFIHPSVVHLIELPTIPSPPMLVKTASGSKLLSDLKCQTLQFTLQNHQFEGEFRVLEVQGYDIILGMDWIAMVGPVIIDCVQGLVKLKQHGKEISLKVQNEVAEVKLCQGELCISKEQQKGSDIILALLFITQLDDANTCTPSTASQHHILPPLQEVLDAFGVVFSDPSSLPPVRSIDHQIPLQSEAVPVNIRPYRFSHFQKLEIEKIVEELLLSGYIRASTSPFASPILLVKKKDQSWRLCVDYRKLNDVTVKNKFPIPIIDDLLDELHGAKFFSKLDLKSGYHQIRMFEPDIPKTAFRTHMGHYEFTIMPFGLTNTPATFQALMNSIFKPYLRKFILVFFDDILVFSTSLEKHKNHLATTLQILQENQLFAKLSKCVIGATEVEYLGHIISENGVATDPSKVVAMTDWPTPKTVKQLRGFLGLTGYYRKFIKRYGVLSRPLTDLLKKDAFKWTDSAQSAFLQLKSAMCQAPVLALPDFTKPFIVETDASQVGIGAVLMQEKRPIAFFSKGLGQKNQGASNVVADALSRREGYTDTVSHLHSELHMVSEIVPHWVTDLLSSYEGDKWIASLKTKLSTDNAATHHLTEHQGSLVTYKRLKSLFYWPSMKEHVMEHVRNCENCQLTKPEHTPLPGLLQPLPIPPEAWNSIGMDFITGLPKSEGKEVLLIVVDRLTKYGHFLPLAHPYSAATVAQVFLDNIYKLHGLPVSIVSNRDPVFTSQFWKELMRKLGMQLNMSTSYHPQTDGQVERVNQCVEAYLRSMVFQQQKKWVRWVPLAEYWYNTNFHSSLHTTPFKALYGYDPPVLALGSAPKSSIESVNELLRLRQQMLMDLKSQLAKAQDRMKSLQIQRGVRDILTKEIGFI
ncbi:hypothetical protein LUZ61_010372 [Rhynchospora tenuis]|uniref:Reverse transcriptase n=1 Tax=Rhynchospora tenuis TaxID=198213 RepID=A0AAD5ZYY1_9POAL|nr:hypothetical protein LUZ61_010372 [Rhynchospora tenuis]